MWNLDDCSTVMRLDQRLFGDINLAERLVEWSIAASCSPTIENKRSREIHADNAKWAAKHILAICHDNLAAHQRLAVARLGGLSESEQKTWVDLLGRDIANCQVVGRFIVRIMANDVKVLWSHDTPDEAEEAFSLWKCQCEYSLCVNCRSAVSFRIFVSDEDGDLPVCQECYEALAAERGESDDH